MVRREPWSVAVDDLPLLGDAAVIWTSFRSQSRVASINTRPRVHHRYRVYAWQTTPDVFRARVLLRYAGSRPRAIHSNMYSVGKLQYRVMCVAELAEVRSLTRMWRTFQAQAMFQALPILAAKRCFGLHGGCSRYPSRAARGIFAVFGDVTPRHAEVTAAKLG